MSYRDKPEDVVAAEEYELGARDNEPLLPRYEDHERQPSPSPANSKRRQQRRRRFPFLCLGVSVAFVLLCFAGSAVYYKKNGGDLSAIEDNIPGPVKSWADTMFGDVVGLNDNKHFPTDIGYAGPTPTGLEAALVVTAPAFPLYSGVAPLIRPSTDREDFDMMRHWGNLSPYRSVKSHGLKKSSQAIPDHCELEEMHWLQRHGARYPTSNPMGPAGLSERLKKGGKWNASGALSFLNDWEYKLGAELLTPFGRSQLYNLGVAARVKYGFLLDRMKDRLPVFRTETQDRMLRSAQNFAAGFFGIPAEDQYNLEVMIEWPGFNSSLAPYHSCPNDLKVYPLVRAKIAEWDKVFLRNAHKRLQEYMKGYELSLHDVINMMDMCPYETVALGHSAFCSLFTEKEWRGYQYRNDIFWWYAASFGAPVARAEGLGWMQELTARLTHTPLTQFNSSVNSTLHNDIHFPVSDPLYVDFTHDTTFAQLLPTLNLTTFASQGPPPLDHIPKDWPFVSSKFAPFATNLQVQVLSCAAHRKASADEDDKPSWWPFKPADDEETVETRFDKRDDDDDEGADETPEPTDKGRFVRIILNDAPVPLTGINGCKKDRDGLCEIEAFVSSMHALIGETDFAQACHDDYDFHAEVMDGRPL
ncbi:hypothetical protein CcaverHIS002_0110580 [Cutaneotrichosporon cavernicola]|uniref:Phosphoglycerate mutase-like protein n=1 Tax=Cutaneotrichosporon cavernicola TaxID=279322 RepID=A0AA48I5Q1_9TREE|nr:uncharacterized protein CcaverHIS019_0110480 [Cutaneotrichosporon cavernicola]BEI80529.1 hypothetical protein CcaverHIS002_0110580 [Cutaneotrichosporon cavernicola]BEI88330.1 hypothetical protein CcaverHIS019_0110480 [Cutaneotrichosporon cavernicola]BEI96103.1 hypothetical protein CcaverHIS631_0110520 [Cutaneotrichosporon cavernicola]BEJ03875.1 hypothetical protein CcaverHIS641_0110500 [Cutaneotrichosporon cavernicola]